MTGFTRDALSRFETQCRTGLSIRLFRDTLAAIEESGIDAAERDRRILREKPWKKYADEIVTVGDLLEVLDIREGLIRFPLDSGPYDCVLELDGQPIAIEVTSALARARKWTMKQMLDPQGDGVGRLISLPDNANTQAFATAVSEPPRMELAEHVLNEQVNGILTCLKKKNKIKYAGSWLVVDAQLHAVGAASWERVHSILSVAANSLPFAQVHVIGEQRTDFRYLRLK